MIIESLGLCYHLQCFKVRLQQKTRRPAKLCLERAWLLGAAGCGRAINKLGAVFVSLCCIGFTHLLLLSSRNLNLVIKSKSENTMHFLFLIW